jgi:hypothetical protein
LRKIRSFLNFFPIPTSWIWFQTESSSDEEVITYLNTSRPRSNRSSRSPRKLIPEEDTAEHNSEFVVRHKDDKLLENRDFSTFINPKPRRSRSPTRRSRSVSPSKRSQGNVTSESIPGGWTLDYASLEFLNHTHFELQLLWTALIFNFLFWFSLEIFCRFS